jgi:hypothetical protein
MEDRRDSGSGIDGGNDDRVGGSGCYLMEQAAAIVETTMAVERWGCRFISSISEIRIMCNITPQMTPAQSQT